MGKRTLSKAQMRQRLVALERRVTQLERPAVTYTPLSLAGYTRPMHARMAGDGNLHGYQLYHDAVNAARSSALDRIQLLVKCRAAAQDLWCLHDQVHDTDGALRRGWRRLQLRLASRLLGFGAAP